jgi:hypothetical protein
MNQIVQFVQIELSPLQRKDLHDILRSLFNWESFKTLLQELNKDGTDYESQNGTILTNLAAVIAAAANENWLISLLELVGAKRPLDGRIPAFLEKLKKVNPAFAVDPFDVCCLSGSHVLVNRIKLRAALRQLVSPVGKRVLIVKDQTPAPLGQSSPTGKSHSVQLMAYLKSGHGFRLINLDLEKTALAVGTARSIQPTDLAERLTRMLGYAGIVPEEPKDAQWARWNLEFSDKFEASASKDNGSPCWIVIDQFNLVLMPQATLDLVRELATRVNTTLDHIRLVLIGFSSTLPATVLGNVEEEEVHPIDQTALIEFFALACNQHGKNIPDADVAQAAFNVLTEAGPDGSLPPAGELAIRVSAELKKLLV